MSFSCQPDAAKGRASPFYGGSDVSFPGGFSQLLSPFVVESVSLPIGYLRDVEADETGDVLVLTDPQDSSALCLYALCSLALCRSAPLAKKLRFGVIPRWYHDGGPFHVADSLNTSVACLQHAKVHCLVQPDRSGQSSLFECRRVTIVPVQWKPQFTPRISAARGPPSDAYSRLGRCACEIAWIYMRIRKKTNLKSPDGFRFVAVKREKT
jgi:hypothetical protein